MLYISAPVLAATGAGVQVLPLTVALQACYCHAAADLKLDSTHFSPALLQRGVFALAEGPSGGAVREGLLAGVVEHLIGIDVEIRWVLGWLRGLV